MALVDNSDIDLSEFLSANTLVARLVNSSDLRGLPGNKVDVLMDRELDIRAWKIVPVLPLPEDAEDGIFYILPDGSMSIWDKDNLAWITTGDTFLVDTVLDKTSLKPIANKPVTEKFEEIEGKIAQAGGKVFFTVETLKTPITDTTEINLTDLPSATADDMLLNKTLVYDADGTVGVITAFVKSTGKVTVTTMTIVGSSGGSGKLSDDLTVSNPLGRYNNGDVIPKDTEFEEIFRKLLTNVYYPTLTNPSATLTYTFDQYVKVGTTVTAKPATLALNRGSINPQYTAASPYRSGAATNYALALSGSATPWSDSSTASGSFSVPAFTRNTVGTVTLTGTINYAAGVQPKDSDGADYNSPLPAGSVTASKTINFILPFVYGASNTATISDFTGLSESVTPKGEKKFKYTTNNQYMVFAYNASYGNLKSILDPNAFETISGWNKSSLTVDGQNYTVYIADAATTDTNAEFTFKF